MSTHVASMTGEANRESVGSGPVSTDLDAIGIDGVSHWFPSARTPSRVLNDINLSIPQGQFVCLVGSSGCGKTTLLNTVAGHLRPEVGSVSLRSADGSPLDSRSIGYMLARDSLVPWRTIRDNVAYGLEMRGVGRRTRAERAEEMLELVHLGGKGNLYPRQLSHGMRQRANLARTLAVDPQVLLVDEPFGALDAQTKANLQSEFTRIWEGTDKTVVFVTHDLIEACLLADRIVVMRTGAVAADISVDFERPRDLDELRFEPEFQDLAKSLWDFLADADAKEVRQ